jgi:hypothetical protein
MPMPKCEHGKTNYYCKECGGSQICVHNKQKRRCKECGGSEICKHNKRKTNCKECGGGQICLHNRAKSQCKDCNGGSICEHNKRKSSCKDCGGSQICVHNRNKRSCKECSGSNICEHNKNKYNCKECCGKGICKHNRDKRSCKECGGSAICEHNKFKSQRKECRGSQICIHNKQKSQCKQCGGSALCKSPHCDTRATNKYKGYCLNCFIHLFPDEPNTKNYKTKEKATADFILEQFPIDKYTWITDKKIQDGCSRKRPDLFLDLGYQVIIVEIDENQHQDYDCSCENKRLMLLSQDVGHRPIVFIRFNPDDYLSKDEKVTSCWSLNGQGICTVKKSKKKEWEERLESLKTQLEYWIHPDNKTDKTIEVVQLFYDSN